MIRAVAHVSRFQNVVPAELPLNRQAPECGRRILRVFGNIDKGAGGIQCLYRCNFGRQRGKQVRYVTTRLGEVDDARVIVRSLNQDVIEDDVVSHPETAAYGRLTIAKNGSKKARPLCRAVCKSQTRRPVIRVGTDRTRNAGASDCGIGRTIETEGNGRIFIPDAKVQCQAARGFDVILKEERVVPLIGIERRFIDGLQKAQRSTVQKVGEILERPGSLGIAPKAGEQLVPSDIHTELQ